MNLLLALLLQGAIVPEGADSARAPRLSYADDATAQTAPRPRVNQGRGFRGEWNALDQSLATEARQERGPRPAERAAPTRAAPGGTTQWNGAPVRMINGQPHGVW